MVLPFSKKKSQGFTLIELLLVIAIVTVIVTLVLTAVTSSRNKAQTARALKEFRSFGEAMELYKIDNGEVYPPDVNRDIPSGLEQYLANSGDWPNGPYPNSVYDWDNITSHGYVQISLRFCNISGSVCWFPNEDWAADFDVNSSMYWCFEGPCRSHPSQPVDHPGYCVNC